MIKQRIKKIYEIKQFRINKVVSAESVCQHSELSIRYEIKRTLRHLNCFNELKNNSQMFFIDDIVLNESINNKIKRRGRLNIAKKSFNDLFPSIYYAKNSWKHNSKRERQFHYI